MTILERCRKRYDLTDYLTHFVHTSGQNTTTVLCYDRNNKPQNETPGNNYISAYKPKDNSSFEVLKKILCDGIIRPSWSVRDGSNTIYGKRAAVCLTEMPILALYNYVEQRNDISKIDFYGIAFKRDQLFRFGARPVIYGIQSDVTLDGKEIETSAPYRMLDQKETINHLEQYRYVRTEFWYSPLMYNTDWMHEREWRWPVKVDDDGTPKMPHVPGIPIYQMGEAIVIVRTLQEKQEILNLLKCLYNDNFCNLARIYNIKQLLRQIKVISLEDLRNIWTYPYITPTKLEEIPDTVFGKI